MATTPTPRKDDRMTIKFRYKGRTFSSARSLGSALQREMIQQVDRAIRNAASGSGARLRKTPRGYEVEGTPGQLARFNRRIKT